MGRWSRESNCLNKRDESNCSSGYYRVTVESASDKSPRQEQEVGTVHEYLAGEPHATAEYSLIGMPEGKVESGNEMMLQ